MPPTTTPQLPVPLARAIGLPFGAWLVLGFALVIAAFAAARVVSLRSSRVATADLARMQQQFEPLSRSVRDLGDGMAAFDRAVLAYLRADSPGKRAAVVANAERLARAANLTADAGAEKHPDVTEGSTNKYQNWEVVDPEKWVPEGYVCVRVDSRGCGRSPGYVDPFSPRETRDFYLCIEWADTQSWSNGKVGLSVISYYAINQWHVASLQPPHLAAMIPWEGAADWYRDMTYHGGIRCVFFGNWFEKQVMTVQYGLGKRGYTNPNTGELASGPETLSEDELMRNRTDLAAAIQDHPLDDRYPRDRSPVWSKITVPFLSSANWGGQGLHPRGNFEGFTQAVSTQK